MKAKLFTLLVAIMASTNSLLSETYSGTCGDNLTWSLNTEDSTLTISGTGAMKNYSDDWNTHSPWYNQRYYIKFINLSNGVTSIGRYAFPSSVNLESITIPNSVLSIGDYACRNCTCLTSVTIPNGVTNIGDYAFSDCSNLSSVYIPNDVTSIGEHAFYSCKGLTNITIPLNVKSIGYRAFSGCSGLTSVVWNASNYSTPFSDIYAPFYGISNQITSFVFGEEVEFIPAGLCKNMSQLASIIIPNSVTSIGGAAFSGCTSLTSPLYNEHLFVYLPTTYTASYEIQDGINEIVTGAFSGCAGLTNVIIPSSVTRIGDSSFSGCSGLTLVTIPDSVTLIGSYAFSGCSGLSTISIPERVSYIGSNAFNGCTGIDSVIWNVQYCNDFKYTSDNGYSNYYYTDPFHNINTNIKSFVFGPNVKQIPDYLCFGMSNLSSIELPNRVREIGKFAFSGCNSMKTIRLASDYLTVESGAFTNCLNLIGVYAPSIQSWNNITFEDVDANPLKYANALYINNKILRELKLPRNSYSVHPYAYYECNTLTSIILPERVSSIGDYTFYNCNAVSSIYNYATTPQEITSNTLYNINRSTCTLYVPEESIEAYQNAPVWGTFVNIVAAPPVDYTHQYTIKLYVPDRCPNIKPTISGEFNNWDEFLPMNEEKDSEGKNVYTYIIKDVEDRDFNFLGDNDGETCNLQYLVVKDSAYWINYYKMYYGIYPEDYATYGIEIEETKEWYNLYSATLPYTEKDTTLVFDYSDNTKYRFSVCDGVIRHVQIGDLYYNLDQNDSTAELTYQEGRSGYGYQLTTIDIPSRVQYEGATYTVTSIGEHSLQNSEMVTSITIPETVTKIDRLSMGSCYNCATIVIPNSVKSIGGNAFTRNANIEYHGTATYTDYNLWWGARSLNGYVDGDLVYADETKKELLSCFTRVTDTIAVPNSVTSIRKNAFFYCKNITHVILPDSIQQIDEHAFGYCTKMQSIKLPNNLTQINEGLFNDCYNLNDIRIPDSVKTIGEYAFTLCNGLKSVSIPSRVDSIGEFAFGWCYALSVIYNDATTPQHIVEDVFRGVNKSNCLLYVPEESVEAYQAAEVWNEFTRINVNFAPKNLHATPDFGKVTLSWEVENEAYNYLVTLYHNDTVWASQKCNSGTHELSFTINNDSAMTFTWSVVAIINNNSYTYNISTVYGEPFTAEPSPYTPRNLQASPNGDGTYTITWDPINGGAIYQYEVTIYYPDGTEKSYYSSNNSCKTGVLPFAGVYGYLVYVWNYESDILGYTSSTLTIEPLEPRDITVRVLVQPNSRIDTSNGVKFAYYDKETRGYVQVESHNEGDCWYNYTFDSITDPVLQWRIYSNEKNYFYRTITSSTCFEFTAGNTFNTGDCDAVAHYYQPYNLQAEPSPGNVTLSWDVKDEADEYYIALLDSNRNTIKSGWTNGHEYTFYLANDTIVKVGQWLVRPSVYSQGGTLSNATAYGESFTVAPSPYIPQNLNAMPNGDGTYTITWDPIESDEKIKHRVYITNNSFYYEGITESSSFVTPLLPTAGEYSYIVSVYNNSDQLLGKASSTFTVAPVEEHDITVRVLIQPYSGYDVSNGVRFGYYDVEAGGYLSADATAEGNGWYNHTFTTTNPGLQFRLMGGQGTDITIVGDTCLEYSRYLNGVDCDAVQQTEFDVTVTSYNCYAYGYSSFSQFNSVGYELICGNSGSFYFKFILPMDQDDIQLGKVYTDSIDKGDSYGYYRPNYNQSSSYITYDSVSFVKTIDADSIEYIEAVIVSTYGVIYRLHYKHDLHYQSGDAEDKDCLFEFNKYTEDDPQNTDSLTYIFVAADNYNESDYEYIALRFVVPEGTTSLPIGSYVISNSLDTMTVWAGYRTISGDFGGSATYYNNYDSGNRYYWYMVSGIVTVDAEKNISVAALNSYGRTISCYLHGNKTTDIEPINTYPSGETESARKILRDGQILILRGEKAYTITGQEVR